MYWAWVDISNNFVLSTMHNLQHNEEMYDCSPFTHPACQSDDSPLHSLISTKRDDRCVLRCFKLNAALTHNPTNKPPLVAQSDAAMRRLPCAREEEEGEEVSLAREVMRPHRHRDDKDTSGWLSSFKSHRADHHTVSEH